MVCMHRGVRGDPYTGGILRMRCNDCKEDKWRRETGGFRAEMNESVQGQTPAIQPQGRVAEPRHMHICEINTPHVVPLCGVGGLYKMARGWLL